MTEKLAEAQDLDSLLAALNSCSGVRANWFQPAQTLLFQDRYPPGLFVILKGTLEFRWTYAGGAWPATVRTLTAGGVPLGLPSWQGLHSRALCTVKASTFVHAYLVPHSLLFWDSPFKEQLERGPLVACDIEDPGHVRLGCTELVHG